MITTTGWFLIISITSGTFVVGLFNIDKLEDLWGILLIICIISFGLFFISGANDIIQNSKVNKKLDSYYVVNVNCYKEHYNQDLRQRRFIGSSYYTLEDDKLVLLPDDCIITEKYLVTGE